MDRSLRLYAVPLLVTCMLAAGPAVAAGSDTPTRSTGHASGVTADQTDAVQRVSEAIRVVKRMEADPRLQQLMQKAKGIYILPHYGQGALGVGARGGAGLMLARHGGAWTGPGFYDLGGISLGFQAGGEGGPIAFLLMTDDAVNRFKRANNFSLNAEAGLTIINYAAAGQASWGKGDVILWTGTEGAYAGAAVGVNDIHWSAKMNRAYYREPVTPPQVLNGEVTNAQAEPLKEALPA